MREHILADKLKTLKLDDSAKIGYTYKTLGCGFYGLRKGENDFRKTLIDVVMEAGDADTLVMEIYSVTYLDHLWPVVFIERWSLYTVYCDHQ